jgi:hypothetical protein
MKGRSMTGRSDSILYSLSEFAFILAFVFIAASAILARNLIVSLGEQKILSERLAQSTVRIGQLNDRIDVLEKQKYELEKRIYELENGNVPCWKRPGGTIPEVAGRIIILDSTSFMIWHYESGNTLVQAISRNARSDVLRENLGRLFSSSLVYADVMNCYIRVEIENRTMSYPLYEELEAIVTSMGMVIAR